MTYRVIYYIELLNALNIAENLLGNGTTKCDIRRKEKQDEVDPGEVWMLKYNAMLIKN